MNVDVNYLAVVVASVVAMAAGFLWYSPAVLGKPWMKLMGYSSESLQEAKKQMGKLYATSFVLTVVMAYMLFHVMTLSKSFYGYPSTSTGLTSGFSMWLGFVLPVQASDTLFGSKNWKLLGINSGYQLVSLLLMGLTIGLMS